MRLRHEQRLWYSAARRKLKRLVRQEYPTTIEECWHTPVAGAIYGEEMDRLRGLGRVGRAFEFVRGLPVFTAWDLGMSDCTSLWLVQPHGTELLWLDWHESEGQAASYYAGVIQRWENLYKPVARHYLPHDAGRREIASGLSYVETLWSLGLKNVTVVPQTSDIWWGVGQLRELLPRSTFHAQCCARRRTTRDGADVGRGVPGGVSQADGAGDVGRAARGAGARSCVAHGGRGTDVRGGDGTWPGAADGASGAERNDGRERWMEWRRREWWECERRLRRRRRRRRRIGRGIAGREGAVCDAGGGVRGASTPCTARMEAGVSDRVLNRAEIVALLGDKWGRGGMLAPMSGDRPGKSHAAAWAVALLIAVPLLYLLSVPPLVRYSEHSASSDHVIVVQKIRLYPVSPTLYYYHVPYKWLAEHTVLETPLDAYMAFWIPPLAVSMPPLWDAM